MTDPKQLYLNRYAEVCKKAFQNFVPDVSTSKSPDKVLKICELASSGMYSKDIAKLLQMSPKAVQKTFRRYNFPNLYNIIVPKMEERHDWKTGQTLMKGYIYQRSPNHPNKTKHGGYVALHRLVVEKKIGRYLLPHEVVDHIDGNILNNHPDNLRVFQSNAEHLSVTLKGKIPKWSEEGKKRISNSVKERHRLSREKKAFSTQ